MQKPRSALRTKSHVKVFDIEEEKKTDSPTQQEQFLPRQSSFSTPSSLHRSSKGRRGSRMISAKKVAVDGASAPKGRSPKNTSSSSSSPDKDGNNGKAQSPRNLFGSFGRRLSSRFGSDKSKANSGKTKPSAAAQNVANADENGHVEEDPVMKIFESRNTQRVRFSLESVDYNAPTRDAKPVARISDSATDNIPLERSSSGGSAAGSISSSSSSGNNIKQFMSRALFGTGNSKSLNKLDEEMKREVAEAGGGSIVWASAATPTGPELVHTKPQSPSRSNDGIVVSFTEVPKARAAVSKLLNKARRAEHIHFRYEYAVKCYVKALDILKKTNYPEDHPTVVMTVQLLNNAHHVLSSYNNSASIVKMGIKYEDSGEFVRSLKMYTIAYRIRRDNLNRNHPSLVVILNMLGGVQIKRGELKEAMQIYELALKDSPVIFNAEDDQEMEPPTANLLAKSVTYREMGVIYERIGNTEAALKSYHKSLECVAEWKEAVCGDEFPSFHKKSDADEDEFGSTMDGVQLAPSNSSLEGGKDTESGEMELFLSSNPFKVSPKSNNVYESFFPTHLDEQIKAKAAGSTRDSFADMDLALTIHRIAQLYRCQGKFSESLDAYEVALRGMKYALGKHHPNVAAILGNMGNLQKEMGDMDAAYSTYQEVLGIESYRLGLSHPDVAITLHNIATIDAAKGNYEHALTLYRKVLGLQKKLFGADHISVSVTAACMGDVYERLGELKNAIGIYEEAVRIKSSAVGRHSLEVARLLHKLGKLSIRRKEFHMAESFISRAVLIYRLNKLTDKHEWIVDAYRDTADIDAALATGEGKNFEI